MNRIRSHWEKHPALSATCCACHSGSNRSPAITGRDTVLKVATRPGEPAFSIADLIGSEEHRTSSRDGRSCSSRGVSPGTLLGCQLSLVAMTLRGKSREFQVVFEMRAMNIGTLRQKIERRLQQTLRL